MDTIGFIGGGNMTEAIVKGLIKAKVYPPENIIVSDILPERLDYLKKQYAVRTETNNASVSQAVDILVLSIKPQQMKEALESVKGHLKQGAFVISIAAGIKTGTITDALGQIPVIRIMPNTPVLVSEGVNALYANELAKTHVAKTEKMFSSVGIVVLIEDEELIDAVTAVSGSGPAYYFLLMEEMMNAAGQLGLSQEIARKLVLQTAKGAAALALEADKHNETPAELRRKVTSRGGTTNAAITVFEQNNFSKIVNDALTSARDRGRELSA